MSALARVRAERLLHEAGIAATVEVAGQDGEIAVVRAGTAALGGVQALSGPIRALGFRYVALEPAAQDPGAVRPDGHGGPETNDLEERP